MEAQQPLKIKPKAKSEPGMYYHDDIDEVDYTINMVKYKDLSDFQKLHAMNNLREVIDHNTSGFPFVSGLFSSGCFPTPTPGINSLSAVTVNNTNLDANQPNYRFYNPHILPPPVTPCSLRVEEYKKSRSSPINIDLGMFPSPGFRFSRDLSQLPDFYRVERETATPITAPRFFACQAPINFVIGNLSILNHTSNVQNFFSTSTSGVYTTQQPQTQSIFTCFYGSAIDQHLALRTNTYF